MEASHTSIVLRLNSPFIEIQPCLLHMRKIPSRVMAPHWQRRECTDLEPPLRTDDLSGNENGDAKEMASATSKKGGYQHLVGHLTGHESHRVTYKL